MSIKSGKVVSVKFDVPTEKQAGGSYPAWQLILALSNGKIESIVKHMNSLKYNAGLRTSLEALVPGDDVNVHLEKKGDFLEVTAVTKGSEVPVSTSDSKVKVAGSNYETKEERAARQRLIVRQSSLSSAIEVYKGADNSIDEILSIADKFTDWVFEVSKEVK